MANVTRTLVEGDSTAFKVVSPASIDISDLKGAIKAKGVTSASFVLALPWQLSQAELVDPDDTLAGPLPKEEGFPEEVLELLSTATSRLTIKTILRTHAMSLRTLPVLDVSELKDGQMKEAAFGEGKVLVSRLGDDLLATSAYCTHYGAPLAKGVLTADGRLVCPWHGACFNLRTGDIEDAPALAPIHSFKAQIDGNTQKICVTADPAQTKPENRARPPKAIINEGSTVMKGKGVVIVGGGSGAWYTVESLRGNGYKAPITILTKEPHVPIDRTKLSKQLIHDPAQIQLTNAADLKIKFGTNVRVGVTVTAVSLSAQTVTVNSGFGTQAKDIEEIGYDQLVLAPGSFPRRLPIDGAQDPSEGGKENIFTLRGVSDVKKIEEAAKSEARVVVIGSSFIAMELVVALAKKKVGGIWVVGMDEVPFQNVLGMEVGKALMEFHKSQGVTFHMRSTVSNIVTSSTTPERASGVVVKNLDTDVTTTLDADLVIMGVGVAPATAFLKTSGLELSKDGGVIVDEFLRARMADGELDKAKKGNVYAIGDIAVYPDPNEKGVTRRIEHWNVAANHGRAVGMAIAGKPLPFSKVPVFWSAQGQQLRYCGYGTGFDDIIIKGDVSHMKFIAYYVKQGKVVAVASMQNDPVVSKASELLRLGLMPSPEELRAGQELAEVDIASTKGKARAET